ncbi:FCD domain-containing protein [Sphaerochaeta sp. PS]|uniref:FadR/GntR family transcriptional regulator n=1 Tax=Sphaerochaeta sp. PS TaxID=3076336 RepID=UPI0028A3AB2D|nr:FCD domain-containing protein [Sphaerochaeta sp. PS]MDT4763348.1 FCD domain-containing protein [Sphaerochaeta sp. PS]
MQKITHANISDTAVESIKQYIVDNNLTSGDQLPSEVILGESLGISRASLREAMKTLEGSGIIETMHGKGRFIRSFNYDQMIDSLTYNLRVHYKDFKEVLQVRIGLEAYFLPRVVGKLTDKDFAELEALLTVLEQQIKEGREDSELVETHTLFHQRLYKVFDNQLLNSLISMFATFQRMLSEMNRVKTSDNETFLQQHKDLLESLKGEDEDKVLQCLKEHFSDFECYEMFF